MKRSPGEIIECILKTCKEPAALTRIVYLGNLNFRTVRPPLNKLLAAGLIREQPSTQGNQKSIYQTTEKGKQALEHIRVLRELLKPL